MDWMNIIFSKSGLVIGSHFFVSRHFMLNCTRNSKMARRSPCPCSWGNLLASVSLSHIVLSSSIKYVGEIPDQFLSCSLWRMFGSLTLLRQLVILQVFMNIKEECSSIKDLGTPCRCPLCDFETLAAQLMMQSVSGDRTFPFYVQWKRITTVRNDALFL